MIANLPALMSVDSVEPLKVLAIAGGAGLGGLITGLLAQLLSRSLTTRSLPGKLLHGSRLGGALAAGWAVALWVFGGGGPGIGGGGGFDFGSNSGSGPDTPPSAVSTESPPVDRTGPEEAGTEVLRIEVLGRETLEKIVHSERPDPDRCYRVEGKERPELLTLAELKKRVTQMQSSTPPLRDIKIILYNDSPAEGVSYVSELVNWARSQSRAENRPLKVDINKPDQNAPLS